MGARRRLFLNCTIRCSTTSTTDWLNVIKKKNNNKNSNEWRRKQTPPTIEIVINQKKKKKSNLPTNKNPKTRCADQSHLAFFNFSFLLKSNAGHFLLSFLFSSFLVVTRSRSFVGALLLEGRIGLDRLYV